MSNSTLSPVGFRATTPAPLGSLLREIYSTTPLAVLVQALKAPAAKR